MSKLITEICDNSCKNIFMESHIETIHFNVNGLVELLTETCPAEFAVPDTQIFAQLSTITTGIDELIKKYEREMRELLSDHIDEKNVQDDVHVERKRLAFANKQIDYQAKMRELDEELKVKENLLSRRAANYSLLAEGNETTIIEYENIIKNYEKEIDDLKMSQTNTSMKGKDTKTMKVSEDRRLKIKLLEKELDETKKKARLYEQTKKAQEQDRKRIEELRKEIQENKALRVKLARESRQEAENYKKFIQTREKEISHLKEVGRKQENQMKRMNVLHEKQQQVLRRKVEEAKAVNKRLQEAMDKGKRVQAMRANSKNNQDNDVVQTWIEHEMSILMSIVDAQVSLEQLRKDRRIYEDRLDALNGMVQKTPEIEADIEKTKEDLDMRTAQISDLQQKVVANDIENKIKTLPDNFTALNGLKIAMRYILNALVELRENFSSLKMKSEEIKGVLEASEERVHNAEEDLKKAQEEFKEEKIELERNFEDRLMLFLENANNLSSADGNMNAKEMELAQKLLKFQDENDLLREKVQALTAELEQAKSAGSGSLKRRKTNSESKTLNTTFDLFDDEEEEDEFALDDSFRDPSWRNPQSVKKLEREKRRVTSTSNLLKQSLINHIEESSETTASRKRSSDGNLKCQCKGSCATKLCGCKKNGSYCGEQCKCSKLACVNKLNDSQNDSTDNEGSVSKENPRNASGRADENADLDDEHTPKKLK